MTLEDDLRKSLRAQRARRKPDTVKLRSIRCLVNEFQLDPRVVGKATNLSPETVRMIAAGEGPYKALENLGPERTRWLAEWLRDYIEENGAGTHQADMVQDALKSVPRLVKPRNVGARGAAS